MFCVCGDLPLCCTERQRHRDLHRRPFGGWALSVLSFGPFWGLAIGLARQGSRGAFTGFINFGGQVGGFVAQIAIGKLADEMKSFHGAILFMIASLVLAAMSMCAFQVIDYRRRDLRYSRNSISR